MNTAQSLINEGHPLRFARANMSLRAKAIAGVACFALYLIATSAMVMWQREKLTPILEGLVQIQQAESTLARISSFSANTLHSVNESYLANEPAKVAEAVELDIGSIQAGLGGLKPWYPHSASMIMTIEKSLNAVKQSPARRNVLDLRAAMQALGADMDELARELHARRNNLWSAYRQAYDSVTLIGAGMFFFGFTAFGGFVLVFFRRLAADLRTLAKRAVDVANGYRGPELNISRADEVGALMGAVNRTQRVLREREQQQEITRQQRFHQEKMVAIGSLAAAVAHEINNPIAAIEGVAEAIHAARRQGNCTFGAECFPELILEHTRRIVGITRQLSEMSLTRSDNPEWTDLNALVRRTSAFVGFDPRFQSIRMANELDASIPAVWAVEDHVTQCLMNLLINAADALHDVLGRERKIEIFTDAADGFVRLRLRDTGVGMAPDVLARACEEGFTTKPSGSGIGLFMCKTLVEKDNGNFALYSVPGAGTTVTVLLPCEATTPEIA